MSCFALSWRWTIKIQLKSSRCGFSLIELLVVIAIIALLIGMLLPAVQKVRESAGSTQTFNNMKQVIIATHSYDQDFRRLPWPMGKIPGSGAAYSPCTQLLPYVEKMDVINDLLTNGGTGWREKIIPAFMSPADFTYVGPGPVKFSNGFYYGPSNFGFNFQVIGSPSKPGGFAMKDMGTSLRSLSLCDGLSNTALLATKYTLCGAKGGSGWPLMALNPNLLIPTGFSDTTGPFFGHQIPNTAGIGTTFQLQPTQAACNPNFAQSFYTSGIHVGMLDGSARIVSPNVTGLTWRYALIPNDDQVPGSDW